MTRMHAEIAALLEAARARTEALLAPFSDAELSAQDDPLQSPLVWDLAHIGAYEELWLLDTETLDDRYDAFKQPRAERGGLELLTPAQTRAYLADVRGRVLDRLERLDLASDDPLQRNAFAHGLVLQHELQHIETMTQTIQLSGRPYDGDLGGPAAALGPAPFVAVAGGTHRIGADDEPWAYDNELDAHDVEVAPFAIAAAPVTNREWATFVADGGEPPLHWREGGELRFGRLVEIDPAAPVCHVSFEQAEEFARRAGARLPTELEWEAAARAGVLGGSGEVWEWTASDFRPYPGFDAFPYREYSEVFFGPDYRVLRGGSWVSDPLVRRASFRNWDFPVRRQIFCGLRLAR